MEASTPETFAFRERMRRRIGHQNDGARYSLAFDLRFEERGVAVTPASDITRYQVTGFSKYRLLDEQSGDVVEGEIIARGAYDSTAAAFATLAAQRDERERIAIELAERTATRLFAAAKAGE